MFGLVSGAGVLGLRTPPVLCLGTGAGELGLGLRTLLLVLGAGAGVLGLGTRTPVLSLGTGDGVLDWVYELYYLFWVQELAYLGFSTGA